MIGKAMTAAALGLLAAGAALGAEGEIAPGFDCKKAASAVEKEICKDGYLTFRDGAMTRLYGALMRALPPGERDALMHGQSDWLKARDRACGGPAVKDRSNCLFQRYERRIGALTALAVKAKLGDPAPLTGFYGRKMQGFNGSITVVEVPGEPVWVEISTVNGPTYHLCDLSTRAAERRGGAIVWTDAEQRECRVTLTFKGDSVTASASQACRTYYCGARGHFADIAYTKARR